MKTKTIDEIPVEIKNEFLQILSSIPSSWNLDTTEAMVLSQATRDFVITEVNKFLGKQE